MAQVGMLIVRMITLQMMVKVVRYTIKTDLNKRKHFRGSFSMLMQDLIQMAVKFFFVIPTTWLDGRHAVFGRIVEGQSIADSLTKNDGLTKVTILYKETILMR